MKDEHSSNNKLRKTIIMIFGFFITTAIGKVLGSMLADSRYWILSVFIFAVIVGYSFVTEKKKEKQEKQDLINEYDNEFWNDLKKKSVIKCKVCDKEIPYNEYGTCQECHEKIMKRLEEKEKEANKNGKL